MRTIFVPVDVCVFVLKNRYYTALQLFLYLKTNCSGQMKIDSALLCKAAADLRIKSIKTIKANLQLLLRKNWIGYGKANGYYYIRGFHKILQLIGSKSCVASSFNIGDINKIKDFVAGVLVCNLAYKQRCKQFLVERNIGRSVHTKKFGTCVYYSVACKAIATYYGVSVGKAFNIKRHAHRSKYARIIRNNEFLKIELYELFMYKKSIPEESCKLFVKDGKVFMRHPDLVLPYIHIKRKKYEL